MLSLALILSDKQTHTLTRYFPRWKLNWTFIFPLKPCLFRGHVCDGALSSFRTCKAQVSGHPHYFLSGSFSALTSLHTREVSNPGCALYSVLLAQGSAWPPCSTGSLNPGEAPKGQTLYLLWMPHHPPVSLVLQWRGRGCGEGGVCLIASSSSNDKERAAQPGSDACIIVVVAKCSWLIIPPSFANGAAAHLHINGDERRVWCQGARVKRVAKLGEHRGHHPYNKQNPPPPTLAPPEPTSLPWHPLLC